MGRGGAFSERGSVTPGILGIRGGSEMALAVLASSEPKRARESMFWRVLVERMKAVELLRDLEQVVS
jgi:hypothetical protein